MIAFDLWYKETGFGFTLAFWTVDLQVKWRGRSWTLNRGKLKDEEP